MKTRDLSSLSSIVRLLLLLVKPKGAYFSKKGIATSGDSSSRRIKPTTFGLKCRDVVRLIIVGCVRLRTGIRVHTEAHAVVFRGFRT